MKQSYSLLLFFSLINFYAFSNSNRNFISIEKLLSSGIISTSISGTGGHSGKCIEFDLSNHASDSTYVLIEAGRRLISNDPGEQDILLLKEQQIVMAPGERKTVEGFGFCCQSSNSSPGDGSAFDIGEMAPDPWVAMAKWVSDRNIPTNVLQQAVWVFSNNHDVRSIPALEKGHTKELRKFVCQLLDIELPWYSFIYAEDSTRLFSGKRTHIYAEVPFKIPKRAIVTGQIRDKDGKLIHQTDSYHASRGENIFTLKTSIEYWADSKYTFYLMEDFHTMNLCRQITLDSHQETGNSSYISEDEIRG